MSGRTGKDQAEEYASLEPDSEFPQSWWLTSESGLMEICTSLWEGLDQAKALLHDNVWLTVRGHDGVVVQRYTGMISDLDRERG
jgi:hypothetical protein